MGRRHKPCPFESGLRKFSLDFVVVIFFKKEEKITSVGLILSLEKFGLILYFNFLQKNIYVVKNTNSEMINSELVIFTALIFLQKVKVWHQAKFC